MSKKSAKELAMIAHKYGYKMQVHHITPSLAYLTIYDNFLQSPYPRHMTSVTRSARYIEGIYERFN